MKFNVYGKKEGIYTFVKVDSKNKSWALQDANTEGFTPICVVSNTWCKLYKKYKKLYNFLNKYGWRNAYDELYDWELNDFYIFFEKIEINDFYEEGNVYICEIEKHISLYDLSDNLFEDIVEHMESMVDALKIIEKEKKGK